MAFRRVVALVLIPTTLLLFTACTKTVWVGPEELRPDQKVKGVVTAEGQEVKLDPKAVSLRGDTIYAELSGDTLRFALEDVVQVGVERADVLASIGVGLGFAAIVVAGLVVVILVSCHPNCISS